MNRKKEKASVWLKLIEAAVTVLVLIILIMALKNVADSSGDDGRRQLETSIRRSVMACYATEGVYPPDVEYLEERFGLQINREKYIVHYSVFAENLVPDITVIERVEEK